MFEPGRSLVADAAVLLSRIENMRMRGATPWLYLDAGYNLLLDSAAVRWYFHMVNASRMDVAATTGYRMVGPLCDSADCFFDVEGEYLWKAMQARLATLPPEMREVLRSDIVRLPETRPLPAGTVPGDVIALLDTGAYTLGEMFQYCGRLRAKAVLVGRRGDVNVIRDRDQPIDLLSATERVITPDVTLR
jgi:diaminopimelate decarboxylase